ncbi:adenylate cyclase [Rhodobium orientis]|uniref:Adenylate/guanylate cyclase domain-containing protein n=1 Tax=Rhodobium orientis TaxID=34017 RepID=A0A327JGS1_9HYPH|nr:adenylate/guanylate cyclase domain-containing protein [Rhodobium orientis]MBB4304452.1 adenylate cyclase [Rhodobium orientis]MBK5949977.1 hypothetical protein [Rhodobium orientis]RAI25600.1 hypothetical protein CH339_17530 [Rhodobium orientis]
MAERDQKFRWAPGQGDLLQRLRLYSGLVLFTFALTHFLNHILGVYSVGLMEEVQDWREAVWHSLPGTVLLAGAALTHATLAVMKTARRRTLRLPPWEAIQLLLGLSIPYYLVKHVAATRGIYEVFGVDVTYTQELSILWPGSVAAQSVLLLIVWTHGCIGIHFWLRIRPWYSRAFPYLLSLAVAIPALAMWGWIDAARRLWLLGQNTGYLTQEQFDWVNRTTDIGHAILIVVVATIAGALIAYRLQRSMVKGIQITYPGDLVIRTPPGPTLLEISRMSGIPHASVCGGRARCSTCRTKILKGLDHLEPPDANEVAVLERIGAESDVRLACQIRPSEDMTVRPLLPARSSGRAAARAADAYYWGVEQTVAVMFIDIRGFTTLSEQRLSYDIVYVLNRYFDVMTRAIDGAGGYVDKFIGDGIMAIFGMSSGAKTGARQALEAAVRIDAALAALNEELAASLDAPLAIGIGIHAGPAILGRIGAVGAEHISAHITALGDTVNTASRLESMSKDYGARLVVSEAVLIHAGFDSADIDHTDISVRGRRKSLKASVFVDLSALAHHLQEKGNLSERN